MVTRGRRGRFARSFVPAFFFLYLILGLMWGLRMGSSQLGGEIDLLTFTLLQTPFVAILVWGITTCRRRGTFFLISLWPFVVTVAAGFATGLTLALFA